MHGQRNIKFNDAVNSSGIQSIELEDNDNKILENMWQEAVLDSYGIYLDWPGKTTTNLY